VNVFISYSSRDTRIVQQIAGYLSQTANVLYWNKNQEPGRESWPSIFSWIDQSDIVLAFITGNTVERAMSVGNEIGHAKAKNKLIIPIVTVDVPESELGCLKGIIYQRFDMNNPGPAIKVVERVILKKKKEKEEQADAWRAIFLVGGAFAFLWATSDGK
jgi:hypothetical protein